MALHYLDPTREPRECPGESGTVCVGGKIMGMRLPSGERFPARDCRRCHGTGRLGEEGAKRDVEIIEINGGFAWQSQKITDHFGCVRVVGPYPTEAAALAAARKAHGCPWCSNGPDCDCIDRRDCSRAGEIGHRQCGAKPCGCPRFVIECEHDRKAAREES